MNVLAEYNDNKGGKVTVIWDKIEYRPESVMLFPPELGVDVYGHTKTVLRYMEHFQDCIENDKDPVPGVFLQIAEPALWLPPGPTRFSVST